MAREKVKHWKQSSKKRKLALKEYFGTDIIEDAKADFYLIPNADDVKNAQPTADACAYVQCWKRQGAHKALVFASTSYADFFERGCHVVKQFIVTPEARKNLIKNDKGEAVPLEAVIMKAPSRSQTQKEANKRARRYATVAYQREKLKREAKFGKRQKPVRFNAPYTFRRSTMPAILRGKEGAGATA